MDNTYYKYERSFGKKIKNISYSYTNRNISVYMDSFILFF